MVHFVGHLVAIPTGHIQEGSNLVVVQQAAKGTRRRPALLYLLFRLPIPVRIFALISNLLGCSLLLWTCNLTAAFIAFAGSSVLLCSCTIRATLLASVSPRCFFFFSLVSAAILLPAGLLVPLLVCSLCGAAACRLDLILELFVPSGLSIICSTLSRATFYCLLVLFLILKQNTGVTFGAEASWYAYAPFQKSVAGVICLKYLNRFSKLSTNPPSRNVCTAQPTRFSSTHMILDVMTPAYSGRTMWYKW